jgi:hypothetical protein
MPILLSAALCGVTAPSRRVVLTSIWKHVAVTGPPPSDLLRTREGTARVTNVELFLTSSVFAVTFALPARPGVGALQPAVLLAMVWLAEFTAWVTNWLEPERIGAAPADRAGPGVAGDVGRAANRPVRDPGRRRVRGDGVGRTFMVVVLRAGLRAGQRIWLVPGQRDAGIVGGIVTGPARGWLAAVAVDDRRRGKLDGAGPVHHHGMDHRRLTWRGGARRSS